MESGALIDQKRVNHERESKGLVMPFLDMLSGAKIVTNFISVFGIMAAT